MREAVATGPLYRPPVARRRAPHRFATPATDDPDEQLVLYWRAGDAAPR